jgi:hypothetical protein
MPTEHSSAGGESGGLGGHIGGVAQESVLEPGHGRWRQAARAGGAAPADRRVPSGAGGLDAAGDDAGGGARAGEELAGRGGDGGGVDVAGDDGSDLSVARVGLGGGAGGPVGLPVPGGPAGGPGGLGLGGGGAGQVAELVEGDVELHLGGLPGHVGEVPGGDEPAAALARQLRRDLDHDS